MLYGRMFLLFRHKSRIFVLDPLRRPCWTGLAAQFLGCVVGDGGWPQVTCVAHLVFTDIYNIYQFKYDYT